MSVKPILSQKHVTIHRKKLLYGCYLCRNRQVWEIFYWEEKRKKRKKKPWKNKLILLFGKLKPKLGDSWTILSHGNRNIPVEVRWKSPVTVNVQSRREEHEKSIPSSVSVTQDDAGRSTESVFQPFNPSQCKHCTHKFTYMNALSALVPVKDSYWLPDFPINETHLAVPSRWWSNNLY